MKKSKLCETIAILSDHVCGTCKYMNLFNKCDLKVYKRNITENDFCKKWKYNGGKSQYENFKEWIKKSF